MIIPVGVMREDCLTVYELDGIGAEHVLVVLLAATMLGIKLPRRLVFGRGEASFDATGIPVAVALSGWIYDDAQPWTEGSGPPIDPERTHVVEVTDAGVTSWIVEHHVESQAETN